ncbi:ATP-dependent metallopeptidase FtsH/Yme1/Tma family protein [Sulfurospirillum diekertiae]|uniref:ATP-dependent metallopeptidase FtsH/Yme1/Tma family protein n=1 Tax=Sulfurospirillum diekertiae TaxID=1854492 RepID=A0A6G9VPI8_9BACT|nr:ATP-dependent metallopeptidase FtsH/Yme1/Tma family protein [Sulfurospirillum diekertiae]QIR74838.1 ATP-dependent metallopeptidase FtsH/Yme1/Tma family protein [Sulfurospirillum diekertiae]QIR77502.1 ATP-dependent metallopeptidase FtsH/Yme1/Tma family protein [Sulfurospirillum diekertiae]
MRIFKSQKLMLAIMALSIFAVLLAFGYLRITPKIIDLPTYHALLESGGIKKAKVEDNEVWLYGLNDQFVIIKDGIDIGELLKKVPIEVQKSNPFFEDLVILGMLGSLLFALFFYARKKRAEDIKKEQETNQKAYASYDPFMSSIIRPVRAHVSFKDVAGIQDVKEELEEIVDFLKNPARYKRYGITLPKGVLLVGPPGVGKTMIAKAVAGEASVPFFYQSGATFVQIYVGMGAKRVKELFSQAKAHAPSIIFIDEIDAVGRARGGMRNDERESTLNQLLTEMDGFEDSSGVIVIAATNKIDIIDEALLRSGRFDRRIFISLPDKNDRLEIIKAYMRNKPTEINLEELANMSVGFSGAALATFVNEAAINALRRGSTILELSDFVAVRQKVLMGKKKVLSFSDEEKKIQALYQAAKALCAYWFEIDFDKISIVNDRLKDMDREIESKTQMLSRIKVYLAGMVATKLAYNEKFTNATEDLSRATAIAKEMVEVYGMGEKLIPYENDVLLILENSQTELEHFLEGMNTILTKISDELYSVESISKVRLKAIIDEVL